MPTLDRDTGAADELISELQAALVDPVDLRERAEIGRAHV